jgi:hypothetical protein
MAGNTERLGDIVWLQRRRKRSSRSSEKRSDMLVSNIKSKEI